MRVQIQHQPLRVVRVAGSLAEKPPQVGTVLSGVLVEPLVSVTGQFCAWDACLCFLSLCVSLMVQRQQLLALGAQMSVGGMVHSTLRRLENLLLSPRCLIFMGKRGAWICPSFYSRGAWGYAWLYSVVL